MAAPIKLSFGGSKSLSKVSKPSQSKAFDEDDDDALGSKASSKASTSKPQPPKRPTAPVLSRQQKQLLEEAEKLDASVFDYDSVYDSMKAAEAATQAARKAESADKRPRYIEGLMRTAEVRRTDRIRAEDKMAERERLQEGDEFADKESFVTAAYKAQQDVLRKAEEEEKRQEAANAGSSKGMASFYKSFLQQNEEAHEAAMKAASASSAGKPVFGPIRPPSPILTQAARAAEAEKRLGHGVQVNEDGEIVDKRELLAGGLNIVEKKKIGPSLLELAGIGKDQASIMKSVDQKALDAAKAAGPINSADNARRGFLSRQRQSQLAAEQLLEFQEKKRKAAEDEELDVESRRLAKRNDASRVEELKRRAAERRKAAEGAAAEV